MKTESRLSQQKMFTRIFILFFLSTFTMACNSVAQRYQGGTATGDDLTLSPYLQIIDNEDGSAVIPLKHTEADVNVTGVIANVKVTQVYQNLGKVPIEAIYVFPGSTRAAVHGMVMKVGERVITAKIKEKGQARRDYEQAKTDGKTASLLEQHRPNVFQMSVANIMPGDSLVVTLRYTELLVPTDGVYEFVYPTVVGPRYNSDPGIALASTDAATWAKNPYQHEGELPFYTFNIKAHIDAGMPIKKALCTSHDMKINFNGPNSADFKLKAGDTFGGNRDVIIRYGLRGGKVQSGLMLFEGEKENFFLAMMEPPARVTPEMIPPREYVFVVDVSGSMHGFPLNVSKSLMKELLGGLRSQDSFNVLLFASNNSVLAPRSLPATKANIQKAMDLIDHQQGGGGTQLLPALKRALSLPHEEGTARSFVIATDGYITVEKEAFDLIRDNLGEANFFSFGIGSSVNRHLIEGLAKVGKGEPFVLTTAKEAKANAKRFREYITSPVLTDITFTASGMEVFDVEPYSVPDVFADRPVIIYGKYKKGAYGKLTIKGTSGLGSYTKEFEADNTLASADNEALKFLWVRKRIQLLDDYSQFGNGTEIKEEVTNLGLKYNLLTAYTSFVAIDDNIRNKNGKLISINQPLPLPEGVSDMAVGNGRNGNTLGYSYRALMKTEQKRSYEPSPTLDMVEVEEADLEYQLNDATTGMLMLKAEEERNRKQAEKDSLSKAATSSSTKIFNSNNVDVLPEYKGGVQALKDYIKKILNFPSAQKAAGISGTVYVEFTVLANGTITDIKIKRGVHQALDAEALRVVKALPTWNPGMKNGNAVAVKMILPIKFE